MDKVCAKLRLSIQSYRLFCFKRCFSDQSSHLPLSYPAFASIQNEPDWNTKDHPCCVFAPAEDYDIPGYYRAFDVVYDTLFAALPRMPEMIGPEATGFDNFATPPVNRARDFQPAWYSGSPRVAAIANHLYDAGVHHDQPGFFDRLSVSLKNARREADQTMTRRRTYTQIFSHC